MVVDDDTLLTQDQNSGYPQQIVYSNKRISNRSAAYLAALLEFPLEEISQHDLGVGVRREDEHVEKNKVTSPPSGSSRKLSYGGLINIGGSSDLYVDLTDSAWRALKVCPSFARIV